jgi:hypothetical protein
MSVFARTRSLHARSAAVAGVLFLGAAAACSGGGAAGQPPGQENGDGGDAARPTLDAGLDGHASRDDASNGDAGPTPDAADASVRDAAGDDAPFASDAAIDASGPDAPNGDASPPDASKIDAGPAVTMKVTLAGAAEPGVLVVFQDDQGAVLSSGTTDPTGAFASAVPSGSQVTVVFNRGKRLEVQTVTALEPGDVLTAVDPGVLTSVLLEVTSLPANPPAAATELSVIAGSQCGGHIPVTDASAENVVFSLDPDCSPVNQVSLLALAVDGDDDQLAYTFEDRILTTGAGTSGIPVSISRPWSPVSTMTLTTPATTLALGTLAYEESSAGTIAVSSAAPALGSAATDADAGIYSFPAPTHPGYPDAVQIEGSVYAATSTPTFLSVQARATRIAPPSGGGTMAIDLTSLLPPISSASVQTETGSPVVAWTTAAPLTDADVVAAWVTGTSSDGTAMTWTVFGPAAATSFSLPALPAGTAQFTPSSSAPPTVYALDASFFTGYADVKTSFASLVPGNGLTDSGPLVGVIPFLPSLGSARLTSFSTN